MSRTLLTLFLVFLLLDMTASSQQYGLVLIKSIPSGARVTVNGQPTQKVSPFQDMKEPGTYRFALEMEDFRTHEGTFEIKSGETTIIEVKLKATRGTMVVSSNPTGAAVHMDGKPSGRTTPARFDNLPSGTHTVRLEKEFYAGQQREIIINDEQTSEVMMVLEENFGTVNIVSRPEASIYLNGQLKGEGKINDRLLPGKYIITAKKMNYKDARQEIEISVGSKSNIILELQPRTGGLAVMTEPPELDISLDGVFQGVSPIILNDIFIGYHELNIGPSSLARNIGVEVREGQIKDFTVSRDQMPAIALLKITKVESTGAVITYSLSSNGTAILSSGICWGTDPNPATAGQKINMAGSSGNFTGTLTGLQPNTFYYVRTYAVIDIGTIYSGQASFITLKQGQITDIDENVYNTVTLGTQTWMKENLRTSRLNDGIAIPEVPLQAEWIGLTTPAYCRFNALSPYGALYNWHAVNTGKLCPPGWHVPSDEEWSQLETFLGGPDQAGGKLKATGTTYWQYPNTGATNAGGFNALPGGYRNYSTGLFLDKTSHAYWWTSTGDSYWDAWNRLVRHDTGIIYRRKNSKKSGFSVRCVKD